MNISFVLGISIKEINKYMTKQMNICTWIYI